VSSPPPASRVVSAGAKPTIEATLTIINTREFDEFHASLFKGIRTIWSSDLMRTEHGEISRLVKSIIGSPSPGIEVPWNYIVRHGSWSVEVNASIPT
jgi:hypothetical protein